MKPVVCNMMSLGIYVHGCTFKRDVKYVPISTYHCSFQKKQTLEAVKPRHLLLLFTQVYRVSINKA